MKYPIIHTNFLEDICDELTFTAYNVGFKTLNVTAEWLFNHIDLAYEIMQKSTNLITEELSHYEVGDDYPIDQVQELENNTRLLSDLSIIQDLEVPYYAHPQFIGNAMTILSEKLSSQLEGKANGEAYYNEYYCKKLAECLSELCEIIKEA